MDYTLNSGAQITVPNMLGSTTKITELDDGNYLVSTQGTKNGSSPTETIMSEDELLNKYQTSTLEKSPENDCFQHGESIIDSISNSNPYYKYNPLIQTVQNVTNAGGIKEYFQEVNDKCKADPEAAIKDGFKDFIINSYISTLS